MRRRIRRARRSVQEFAKLLVKTLVTKEPYFGTLMGAEQINPHRMACARNLIREAPERAREAPLRILEIGSWSGGSAIVFAKAIQEFHAGNGIVVCVDPWESYIDTSANTGRIYKQMERATRSNRILRLFLHNVQTSGCEGIVHPFKARSQDALILFSEGSFDMIYIDGDHSYSGVQADLRGATRLVADGGILCGDDLELQLHRCDVDLARANSHVDFIKDPRTGNSFHPGVTLAVGEILGEVSEDHGFWAVRRSGKKWESVELSSEPQPMRTPPSLRGPTFSPC